MGGGDRLNRLEGYFQPQLYLTGSASPVDRVTGIRCRSSQAERRRVSEATSTRIVPVVEEVEKLGAELYTHPVAESPSLTCRKIPFIECRAEKYTFPHCAEGPLSRWQDNGLAVGGHITSKLLEGSQSAGGAW